MKQNEQSNQKLLLTDISTLVNLSYELIDKLLSQKEKDYKNLHQFTRSLVLESDKPIDVLELQLKLEQKSGFPIDLYIINENLIITDTTFPPDLGLDFKLPLFIDAQYFLNKARKTGQIMVSQPNMEYIKKQFKIYSYSVLDDNRYLELGFIDPDIDGYFYNLTHYFSNRSDAQITLFIEYWNKILVPMSIIPEKDTEQKLTQLKQVEINNQNDQQAFRHTINNPLPYKTHTIDMKGQKITSYYIEATGISNSSNDELSIRYLAKINFNNQKILLIKENFQLFLLISVLISIAAMFTLSFYMRHWLIEPINHILASIKNKVPVILTSLPNGTPEISKIAITYNNTLKHIKQGMLELERQSTTDPLTGLDNRKKFINSFNYEISRARRHQSSIALTMIDIDYLKKLNDRYGHQEGDLLLYELAQQMKSRFLRPSDHLCRMGGDEFSTLLVDIDPSTIVSVFEILQQKWIAQYYEKSSRTNGSDEYPISISVGIYVFHSSLSLSWEYAYQQADKALYTAKDNGRNQIIMIKDPCVDNISIQ